MHHIRLQGVPKPFNFRTTKSVVKRKLVRVIRVTKELIDIFGVLPPTPR